MRLVPTLVLIPLLGCAWSAEPAKAKTPPAADAVNANGTDPTTPINRIQGTLGLTDLPHSGETATVIGRIDYVIPGHQDIAMRADIPLVHYDYGPGSESGLGDCYVEALKTLPVTDQRVTAAAALGMVLPTASDPILGYEKWILAPKLVGALHMEDKKGLAYLQVQDFFSVSGDDDRADVHYLVLTGAYRQNLDQGVWVLGGLEDRYDWKRQGWQRDDFRNNFSLKLEGGILFAPDKAAWVDLFVPVGDHHYMDIGIAGTVMLRY